MRPTDLYMILVYCNDIYGNMTRRAGGVEIFSPDDPTDSVFSAHCLLDDEAIAFWETKHGIMFHLRTMDESQINHIHRRFYPAIHGAQHVGNICWNAYFCTEDVATGLAIDLSSQMDLHPEGEWQNRIEEIEEAFLRKQKERQEWNAHPKLFARM